MAEIIAEIGQNHNGDMDLAVQLIRQVKKAGADVAKFQVYDAKALFPKEGNEWYDYNLKTEISREQVQFLAEACDKEQVEFMASVFDVERIQWLEDVGVKRYKIASRSIHDKPLYQALLATGKPLIASLGMWEKDAFPELDNTEFLFCVSKYPTELADIDFNKIDFKRYVGFSDHTIGTSAVLAALSRGAKVIEKHFTLDKSAYGPDHSCSMDLTELEQIVNFKKDLAQMSGASEVPGL